MDLQNYGPGRPQTDQTLKTLAEMVRIITAEPGIQSARLAKQVGLPSLQCAIFAKRLEKKGVIKIQKVDRALTYTLA